VTAGRSDRLAVRAAALDAPRRARLCASAWPCPRLSPAPPRRIPSARAPADRYSPRAVALGRDFKAVFFDLDGTLVDIHGPLFRAARKAIDQLGHGPPLTLLRYRAALARDDLFLGLPDHLRPQFLQLLFTCFVTELNRTTRPEVLPHVHETLAELKRRGYATAVITSRPGDSGRLVRKLARIGLADCLDQVLTQPEASLLALDKTASLVQAATDAALAPAACMYVGDEPRDTMAAHGAGYGATVAIATGAATFARLRDHPQHRPDHTLHSMGELIALLDRLQDEPSP
jgi:N-acetyl-D-muramate 6-phosphate phosphatase